MTEVTNDNYPGDVDFLEGIPILSWIEDHVIDWPMIKLTDYLNNRYKFHFPYGYWEPVWEIVLRMGMAVLVRALHLREDWTRDALREVVKFNIHNTARHNIPLYVPDSAERVIASPAAADYMAHKGWVKSVQLYRQNIGSLTWNEYGDVSFRLP